MSIRVVCPNGHESKIKDRYAGMRGACPICKVPLKVPEKDTYADDMFGEQSIMDVLQPQESGVSGLSLQISDIEAWDQGAQKAGEGETTKTCAKCHKRVSENAHVCPHCHSYMPPLQW
jgi:hypothetical protein